MLGSHAGAEDWWTGLDSYERGYYIGYVAFEVAGAAVAAGVTAAVGGTGALVTLSRHAPKLLKILNIVKGKLSKAADAAKAGLSKVFDKLEDLVGKMSDASKPKPAGAPNLPGPWCFAAGTAILTLAGPVPVEAVAPGDLVVSADESSGRIGVRPVMEIYVREVPAADIWEVAYDHDADPATAARALHCTGEEGWKRPVAFFVTHPEELVHLGIDADGDGAADEVISGTAPHPFWVCGEDAFVPMGELEPGDTLWLDGGTQATVATTTRERAPPGETFTTYNFEVADYHTYFVGESGVWVHNTGRGPCEVIFSIYHNFRKRAGGNETQWDSLIKERHEG